MFPNLEMRVVGGEGDRRLEQTRHLDSTQVTFYLRATCCPVHKRANSKERKREEKGRFTDVVITTIKLRAKTGEGGGVPKKEGQRGSKVLRRHYPYGQSKKNNP